MQLRVILAALVFTTATLPLHAQIRDVRMPNRNWGSAWAGMYTRVDNVYDPGTDSGWYFDDPAFAVGVGLEREVSHGLLLGVEGSYGVTDFERRGDGVLLAEGDANLITALATGRYNSGGGGSLNLYLKGGIGVFGYRVPDPEETNFDFALSWGTGLEYRFRPRVAGVLEWNQYSAYHEKEGLDGGNTARHSMLRLGVRAGF